MNSSSKSATSLGIPVREAVLRDDDLFDADEAFLTSTTREVLPIVTVDGRPIGSGRPGPVTRKLLDAYRAQAHDTAVTRGSEQRAQASPLPQR